MKEFGGGTAARERTRVQDIPPDLEDFDRAGGWLMSYSTSARAFTLEVSDYHPGLLVLDREDLRRMLARMGGVSSDGP